MQDVLRHSVNPQASTSPDWWKSGFSWKLCNLSSLVRRIVMFWQFINHEYRSIIWKGRQNCVSVYVSTFVWLCVRMIIIYFYLVVTTTIKMILKDILAKSIVSYNSRNHDKNNEFIVLCYILFSKIWLSYISIDSYNEKSLFENFAIRKTSTKYIYTRLFIPNKLCIHIAISVESTFVWCIYENDLLEFSSLHINHVLSHVLWECIFWNSL